MLLKQILAEVTKDDAALEYLSSLVKSGPFKNKVFLAGGSPRDMEMGMSPKDLDVVVKGDISAGIDFATWATKEIGNYKQGSNPVIFPTYGTAKFTLAGVNYKGIDLSDIDVEAVAPRKEKYTAGSRKPEVFGGELEDDVHRRDFTVNSLLRDLTTGETLDLTGLGKADIKAGIVRTPLNPDIIFSEDPLRILRAIRFAAKYDWKLPMFMIKAIKKNAGQLVNISKERIHDEVNKMLLVNYPYKAFRLMQILGTMKYVFPTLENANIKHILNTKLLEKNVQLRLISVFSASTPDTVKTDLLNAKYSTDVIRDVVRTLELLPRFLEAIDSGASNEYLRTLRLDYSQYVPYLFSYMKTIPEKNVAPIKARYIDVSSNIDNFPFPVSGKDLIDMGIKSGPIFRTLLTQAKQMYIANPATSKEEYMKMFKAKLGDA